MCLGSKRLLPAIAFGPRLASPSAAGPPPVEPRVVRCAPQHTAGGSLGRHHNIQQTSRHMVQIRSCPVELLFTCLLCSIYAYAAFSGCACTCFQVFAVSLVIATAVAVGSVRCALNLHLRQPTR
jgi:hypothetical protein